MPFSHLVFVHFLFLRLSTVLQVLIFFFPFVFVQFLFISHGLPHRFSMTSFISSLPYPCFQILSITPCGCRFANLSLRGRASPVQLLQFSHPGAAPWQGQGGLCCPAPAGPGALLCSAGAEPRRNEGLPILGHHCFLLCWEWALKWLVAYLITERWQLFTDISRDFLC